MGGAHTSESLGDRAGHQVRRRGALVVGLLLVGGALALGLALVGRRAGVELSDLSRDPDAVAGLPVYVGALAFFAFVGWSTAFAGGATGWLVARRLGRPERALMLALGAGLSLWLLLDDMFEFHESVLPRLGVSEKLVYGLYVLAVLVWIWFFRELIRDSDWLVLVLALGLLGGSAVLDELFPGSNVHAYVEDVLKMLGTWMWGLYFVLTAVHDVPAARLDLTDPVVRDQDLAQRP